VLANAMNGPTRAPFVERVIMADVTRKSASDVGYSDFRRTMKTVAVGHDE